MLYCTPRLQKELNLNLSGSTDAHAHHSLGGWHVDLFWCERRKCILFTSESTFLSFVVLDVFRSEMRPLRAFFLAHLESYLKAQGVPGHIRDEILDEYANVKLTPSDDPIMSETMQDLIFHARFLISHAERGIRDIDALEISRQLSDVPITGLEALFPWRAARVALGLESSDDVAQPILSHHPLARRVGSPTLTVINGGR